MAGEEGCVCSHPCSVCHEETPAADRLPWPGGVAHFGCAGKKALGMSGRGRVVMLVRRRMANDNPSARGAR
jgi:hypothetical protein